MAIEHQSKCASIKRGVGYIIRPVYKSPYRRDTQPNLYKNGRVHNTVYISNLEWRGLDLIHISMYNDLKSI